MPVSARAADRMALEAVIGAGRRHNEELLVLLPLLVLVVLLVGDINGRRSVDAERELLAG